MTFTVTGQTYRKFLRLLGLDSRANAAEYEIELDDELGITNEDELLADMNRA